MGTEVNDHREGTVNSSTRWELDLKGRELRHGGVPVPLGSRAFEIVEVLVRSAGAMVTKGELLDRIWPGAFVSDNTLQVHISAIRKALGADRGLLKTASGRGYRLLGDWTTRSGQSMSETVETETISPAIPLVVRALPVPGTELIGRANDAQRLSELLSAYRVVTLTGPGGIGKTRLAMEVAHQFCQRNGHDCAVVELVSLSDPSLVISAFASALGLPHGGDDVSPVTVARVIGDRTLLLVLDNCEHVVEAAAQLAEAVVHNCPHATLLTTSRELLRIDGEFAFHVRALDVPTQETLAASEMLDHSAVQLFIARTRASGGMGDEITPSEFADIATICKRLDGIPLAIELAAARAATLGLSEVVRRLDDRFTLLTSGRRTALPRHQTLRAALDWSYDLLSENEQALLRSLAVFAAGFTLEAAVAVADRSEANQRIAVDDIASLVGKSLIYLDRTSAPERWRLLETTRVYALERLRESGEFDIKFRRLAEFCVKLLSASDDRLTARLDAERVSRLAAEINNIRAALDWAFSPQGDVAIGTQLTIGVIPVWLAMSLLVECRERVERALNALTPDTELGPRVTLQLHAALGISLLSTTGLQRETKLVLSKTLAIATELDDPNYQLQALWALWTCCFNNGENLAAEPIAQKFLQVARRAANPADMFVGERLLGVTMHYRGRQVEARRHLEHVLANYIAPGDGQHVLRFHYHQDILARAMFARVLWLQGYADQALRHAEASIVDAQTAGHVLSLCYALAEALCPIALMTGNLSSAMQAVTMLTGLARKYHLDFWENWGRCLEGNLLIEGGDTTRGMEIIRSSLNSFRSAGWSMRFPIFLGVLATGLAKTGQMATALGMIDEGLGRAESNGEMWCFAELVRMKGEIILQSGTPAAMAAAAESFKSAIGHARSQDALFWELRATTSLARLHHAETSTEDAIVALRAVYERFTEGFDTVDLTAARSLLKEAGAI
jgi:predicted ATPase/DNA-binding winged helix-turn-helix (wHTH) protein